MDLRHHILAADDLPTEDVYVPEWGCSVRVRGLTAEGRDLWEASWIRSNGRKADTDLHNFRAKLVVRSVVDEQGERIFQDADVEALGRKSALAVDRLFAVARRLSGLTADDLEELEKNSASGRSSASAIDSPATFGSST